MTPAVVRVEWDYVHHDKRRRFVLQRMRYELTEYLELKRFKRGATSDGDGWIEAGSIALPFAVGLELAHQIDKALGLPAAERKQDWGGL